MKNAVLVTSLPLVLAVVPSPVNGKTTVAFDPCPGLGKGVSNSNVTMLRFVFQLQVFDLLKVLTIQNMRLQVNRVTI